MKRGPFGPLFFCLGSKYRMRKYIDIINETNQHHDDHPRENDQDYLMTIYNDMVFLAKRHRGGAAFAAMVFLHWAEKGRVAKLEEFFDQRVMPFVRELKYPDKGTPEFEQLQEKIIGMFYDVKREAFSEDDLS